MADRSAIGWNTVAEYEADPIASDSDDGKKIRQAKNRALTKQESKNSNKPTFPLPSQRPTSQQFRVDGQHNGFTPPSQQNFNLRFPSNKLPRTATFDGYNGPVAPVSDRGTRVLVTAKEGTGANTA